MGLRGIGAKPLKGRNYGPQKLRKRLPWQRKGLTRVQRVVAFCQDLKVTAGPDAGKRFKLRPWQRKFIEAIYAEDGQGSRPVRTAVLSMGRKNGKTTLAAALALCHLAGPESEMNGEVFSCANDRAQAAKVFREMCAMLRMHLELDDRLNVRRFTKEIEDMETGSIYAALSADAGTKQGLNPSFVVYDELGTAPNRALFDAMDTAMGGRSNPIMVVISTQAASDSAPLSELIDYGKKIAAGEFEDPSFHLTLYAAAPDTDPWSKKAWAAANPALGDFRSLEDVERQATQARTMASKEQAFRNLILNQRVAAHVRAIPDAEWRACKGGVDRKALEGRLCFGGLDLSGGRDLTAFVLVFPREDGCFEVLAQHFLPTEGIAERAREDREPYDLWAKDGWITAIEGNTIDPAFVATAVAKAAGRYELQWLAFDRWKIRDFQRELEAIGSEIPMLEHGQGFIGMAPACDILEREIAERRLIHDGNPVLSMCAKNTIFVRDAAGNRKFDKAKSKGRIDGIVALAMALSAAKRAEPPKRSIYEDAKARPEGLLFL